MRVGGRGIFFYIYSRRERVDYEGLTLEYGLIGEI